MPQSEKERSGFELTCGPGRLSGETAQRIEPSLQARQRQRIEPSLQARQRQRIEPSLQARQRQRI
ncbi:hypothetical protein, partial [Lachnoclostridium sp. An14]|uniref:hypothetical protein n=1 Tax=Lachnoclostridium sp. An14 TaxID=1965562 RepID=UPI00117A6B57